MVMSTMVMLMVATFSGFQLWSFFIFSAMAIATVLVLVLNLIYDNRLLKKSREYEEIVIEILSKWNKKYREKGIKFSIMRSFYVLMIHADYKKPSYKYNLVFGKRIFDKNGKLIK